MLLQHSLQPSRPTVFVILSLCLLFLAVGAPSARAVTITVTNTNDSGSGSLRQAISDAVDGDTIDFDLLSCPCTITLAEVLNISKLLTIRGAGATNLTLYQGSSFTRVLSISGVVTISGIRITNGETGGTTPGDIQGGGIRNGGTLVLENVIVEGNRSNTRGASHGGGIYNSGTITIRNSVITGNAGGGSGGGGVYNALGSMMIAGSTISGNSGEGIRNSSGVLEIWNSTISGNTGVGIANNNGTLTLRSSTVSGNICGSIPQGCGLLALNGSETLFGSIFAGNGNPLTQSDISGEFGGPAVIETAKNNLIANPANSGILDGAEGNIVGVNGTGTLDIDLILDTTLRDNGGPTKTHRVYCGSPAIDAGNNSLVGTLSTDQRGAGFDRIRNGGKSATVDIGAFEVQTPCQNPPTLSVFGISQQKGTTRSNVPIAVVGDPDQSEDTLSVTIDGGSGAAVNGVSISNLSVDAGGIVTATISVPCSASDAAFILRVRDSEGFLMQTSLNVDATSAAPVMTLRPGTSIVTVDHNYAVFNASDLVASVTDDCDSGLLSEVVIERVISDEEEDANGNADGQTLEDIVIAGGCKAFSVRRERDVSRNGRVYNVFLSVRDADGNITIEDYRIEVPISERRSPAIRDANAYTVFGGCG